ncbi:MAG: SGNH/GDSL hydrolase family protein [Bacteroidales bacterium]|nr:SGNH/GDSL hydrolase family protein [Bacteroidales bacterium]
MKQLILTAAIFLAAISAAAQTDQLHYIDATAFPLYGKIADSTSTTYGRLSQSTEDVTRKPVARLGRNSAGLSIRFRSNAPEIHARWHNTAYHMPHMTDVGVGGLDLYILLNGKWHYAASGFTWDTSSSKERKLIANMEPVMREYLLNLPLYDNIDSLELAVPDGYVLEGPAVDRPVRRRPVVMYGTSILQGGCASRPGMAHTNIISRRLDREVINLGFSGNAKLDLEIARWMASVPDPGVFVLDYAPNSVASLIDEKGEAFFRILRDAHPDVPVIFVEDPLFPHIIFDKEAYEEVTSKNASQKALYERLRKQGEKNVYFVSSRGMIDEDGEATVDGIHLTDYGMMRYADLLAPVIAKALRSRK